MTSVYRDALGQLGYLPRTLNLVWAANRRYALAWGILLALSGLVPAAVVFLTRLLVDSLVDVIGAGSSWESARPILLYGGMMAGVLLLAELLSSAIEWIRTAQAELVRDHIAKIVHEKSISVDFAFYESSDFHDRLDRARSDADVRSVALLENGGALIQNGVTLIAMAALLVPYGVWLPFALLASTVPGFYVVVRHSGKYHAWSRRTTQERRWVKYYDLMMTHSSVAAELRLFTLGGYFRSAYTALRDRLRTQRLNLAEGQGLARFGAGALALVVSTGAMVWMVWRALSGLVSLGDLVLFYQAFGRGQGILRVLLNNLGQMYANSLFIKDLFEFLELEPTIVDPARPRPAPASLTQGISFRGVTFSYPGSERAALREFDLVVPAGRTVAIVGANGAGKTTLVKLLCRLYDPSSGSISLDGTDIRHLTQDDLRSRMTVLFQHPVHYHAAARQNIGLGDLQAAPDAKMIEAAARQAGAHELISRLPDGYDTLLGKWFADGAELSWGEWQRIGLARALVREAPIIVLDEPTSFMDSWSEIEWMDRFRVIAEGRTAIIITHRFTTAMRADIIHVMDQGRILEAGTHHELIAGGGLYARSWSAQMLNGDRTSNGSLDGGFASESAGISVE